MNPAIAASNQGWVARILPFSSVDGPGNRFVVFLQGCDFNCTYCHNPETRAPGSRSWDGSHKPLYLSAEHVVTQAIVYRRFLRGATISGGECLLQPHFTLALIREFRDRMGIGTLLDTCGSRAFADIPEIIRETEGIMLDVKAWDPQEHQKLTGADNALVLRNLRMSLAAGVLTEVRTVILPESFDCQQTVTEVARLLAGTSIPYVLIVFRPHGVRARYASLTQPDQVQLTRLADAVRAAGHDVVEIR